MERLCRIVKGKSFNLIARWFLFLLSSFFLFSNHKKHTNFFRYFILSIYVRFSSFLSKSLMGFYFRKALLIQICTSHSLHFILTSFAFTLLYHFQICQRSSKAPKLISEKSEILKMHCSFSWLQFHFISSLIHSSWDFGEAQIVYLPSFFSFI